MSGNGFPFRLYGMRSWGSRRLKEGRDEINRLPSRALKAVHETGGWLRRVRPGVIV
jgi:hypothetical protein